MKYTFITCQKLQHYGLNVTGTEVRKSVNVPTATLILSVCTWRALIVFRSRIIRIDGLGRAAQDPYPQL